MNNLKPCPLCGGTVKLAEISIESDDVCDIYSAKIECGCGLSFKKEWTDIKTSFGYIKQQEDIFTAWNRRKENA